MTILELGADETLHVLVPSRRLAEAVEAFSPRVRAHRVSAEDGPPQGEAALAQMWVHSRGSVPLPEGFLEALPRLRLVQLTSAGAEGVVGRLPEGLVLCNARGAHTPSTAEWVMAATLAAQRGLPSFVREQDAGRWSFATHSTLVGARVLVIGAGDIGTAVGRMLSGFDVQLTYVARSPRPGVRTVDELPELLPQADVVVLLVPLTAETTGLVDAEFLAAMPDGALLVNAARGPVVDTDALLAELTAGRLRAAVDVTDPEPLPADHPLWRAPGLLLTPHVAGEVPQTGQRALAAVTAQIGRILAGEPLADVVGDY
ncbi:2-hydroxyacid dehydrogenase [Blastococcus xanthinilyticus]|uniref:Phosphoglycerate dehydrogenase-like enzyme n=1 Tax=Blastococcus xanthinilyticus TaxID=1564164 RepID=A0A5S5CQ45_9ACTN|nr:2-hydroxyacid dehydrogenase [Blastococcus xanthinilyticus]TYP85961.1 phosphoglycerate dehydrogenase-like enzyme [Blastococcus xanthinilyticus]